MKSPFKILLMMFPWVTCSSLYAQSFLIPETAMVQHAGSIGYASFGVGYNLFRKEHGSLDLTWGYVPKSKGGRQDIFAAKFAIRPWKVRISEAVELSPLNPGVFVSHHAGGNFHTKPSPDPYPKGYYWWSSAVRFHISASTEVKVRVPSRLESTGLEQVSFYTEVNTNELYAVSWFKNRDYLPFRDIFRIGIGVKAYF